MSDPITSRADLRALSSINTQEWESLHHHLNHDELSDLFRGTDLFVTEDGKYQALINGTPKTFALEELISQIEWVREVDANGDNVLDLDEAERFIEGVQKSPINSIKMDPQAVLQNVQALMDSRFVPLALNLKRLKSELPFRPIFKALQVYNYGLYLDDERQADATMSLNGLTKTAGNVATFIPYNFIHRPAAWMGFIPPGDVGDSWMLMDDVAKSSAQGRYHQRTLALSALGDVIQVGIKNNEAWALEGNFEEALNRLSSEDRDLIATQMPAQRLNEILNIPDEMQQDEALFDFAQGERPGFLGYGGGNNTGWSRRDWFNYTGRHNNLYFARSVFAYLGQKSAGRPELFYQSLHQRAVEARKDMMGEGGGVSNMASVGLSNVLCIGGLVCDTVPYRSWGDEQGMNFVGEFLGFGLSWYAGAKVFEAFREAGSLMRLRTAMTRAALPEARVIPRNLRDFRKMVLSWKPPANLLPQGKFENLKVRRFSWWSSNGGPFQSQLANATFRNLGHTAIFLGASELSERNRGYYNPFETDQEMNLGSPLGGRTQTRPKP